MRLYFIISIVLLSISCGNAPTGTNNSGNSVKPANTNSNTRAGTVPQYSIEIVKTYPHDVKAFTQGLVFLDGFLYEGTGGKQAGDREDDFTSSLRKVEIESGKVLQKFDIPRDFFGEGIAVLNDKIYQLTWQERTGFVYNLSDFKLIREVRYSGEGWGLTHDGTNLIMSDGTHIIRFVNPEDFTTLRTIHVDDEKGQPLKDLNELEYVKGEIWANVWQTGWIVRIDPATGKLLGRIDVNALQAQEQEKNRKADVLNGIAYDSATDRIFITGKNWSRLFEIKVNPK